MQPRSASASINHEPRGLKVATALMVLLTAEVVVVLMPARRLSACGVSQHNTDGNVDTGITAKVR